MFELYVTGLYSFKQIANELYAQGLRTRAGKKVSAGQIHKIIGRTFYYGVMETGGQYYQGNHEPLISQELFNKCQELSGNKARPRAKTKGFTLSGFVKCEKCGCAVTAEIKKGKYIYYHCTNGKGSCDQKSFNANEKTLDEQIAADMERLKISEKMVDIVYRAKIEELEQSGEYHNHALEVAQNALKSLALRKSRLVDTFTAGDIDEELYRSKLRDIDRDSVNLKNQIEELERNSKDPRVTIELVYERFKRGYTMAKRYRDAGPAEKRIVLAEALSNSTMLDRNMAQIQYKSPYEYFARTPVNASFSEVLPDRDSNPSFWCQKPTSYH